ncbi:MAG: PAS domain-containing protein [Desulfovibrionaceae bacterium]|nr:PAS domain-containing protein [Desulfovibrionaceae bacterium]
MTLKRTIFLSFIILIAAAGLMVFSYHQTSQSQEHVLQIQAQMQTSLDLAAELQTSSQTMTIVMENYVVTGKEHFMEQYDNIVATREGKKPRPQDSMTAPGETVSLVELMRRNNFTERELALLEESNELSNNLIKLETQAVNAVRGLFPDANGEFTIKGEPDKETAIALIFNENYDNEVAKIMAPIEEFNTILNERLTRAANEAQAQYDKATLTFQIIAGLVLLLFASFLIMVNWKIIRPILRCDIFANEIANGNLDAKLDYTNKNEIGMLADSLRSIPDTLKQIVDEYTRLERQVEYGDLNASGNSEAFKGAFANLIGGTNRILDRFKTMIDAIPSPVVVLDDNLKCNYLNQAAQEVTSRDYKGKTCGQLMAREDFDTAEDALQVAVKTGAPATAETRAHPNGKNMEIAYTAIPFFNQDGRISSVLQLITDLTSIKQTQRTIVEVAQEAMDISNRVASAAEELSAQVEQVSRGTDIQRDRAASTATAMEEMNSTVLEVARNASEASESAEACRDKATEGSELVSQVIQAIQLVNEISQEINLNMEKLSEEAQAIGGVMDVISDIADQTNLLALNAAIEAARAGEAGRGFAVVADEVRKLAEKTMSATNEVGGSIRGIQASTAQNRERVVVAAEAADKANQLATTSGMALNEIVDLANNNSALIAGIATAAEEQSATSDEINNAVDEINHIAADTADGMSQSADAVSDLAGQAQELKQLLQRLQA